MGQNTGSNKSAMTDSITAKEIVERMGNTYTSCQTYRDSGIVTELIIFGGNEDTREKPFCTVFIRPDRYRFEYKEMKRNNKEYRYIIWRNGKDVQTWWDVKPGIKKLQSLEFALAGATGVSGGSAYTIPTMLVPQEIRGRRLTDMTEMKRIEDVKINKVDCFCIQGLYAGNPRTLWICKKTFLVRRIYEEGKFDNVSTQSTTTYNPYINREITEKMLKFDPPNEK